MPGKAYWHILKSLRVFGVNRVQRDWDEEREGGYVSAGYGNEPDGPGQKKLSKYANGDRVFMYVPGRGLVGMAEVESGGYHYLPQDSRDDHAHRLSVKWIYTVGSIDDAVSIGKLREIGLQSPRTLATKIPPGSVDALSAIMKVAAQ